MPRSNLLCVPSVCAKLKLVETGISLFKKRDLQTMFVCVTEYLYHMTAICVLEDICVHLHGWNLHGVITHTHHITHIHVIEVSNMKIKNARKRIPPLHVRTALNVSWTWICPFLWFLCYTLCYVFLKGPILWDILF